MDDEEAALLAELLAISSRSTSTRFAECDDETMLTQQEGSTISKDVAIVESEVISTTKAGFKDKPQAKTFQGDRGGDANDDELLAELMAISNKNKGVDRFADETVGESESQNRATPAPEYMEPTSRKPIAELPPWKRKMQTSAIATKSLKNSAGSSNETFVAAAATTPISPGVTHVPAPAPAHASIESEVISTTKTGFKDRPQAKTFQGDRGGDANDDELLAELMAISNKNKGVDRFADETAGESESPNRATVSTEPVGEVDSKMQQLPALENSPVKLVVAMQPDTSIEPEFSVSRDSLPAAIVDRNWKVRKEAFILIRQLLNQAAKGRELGDLNASVIIDGLDSFVPLMVSDKNASALDFGLQFAIDYAEFCNGATSADQASAIVNSIFNGGGFSATRVTTVKLCSSLTLKLMEVGADAFKSVHSVINVLLERGLASRKPKEVTATTSVILDAAFDFGAACLPLAAIKSSSSKMLSHSNASVRDTGVKILAEICRTLGSKSPVQDVLESMKKAQMTQLEEMLRVQAHATPPKVGLRNSRSGSQSTHGGTTDALAEFEEQTKLLAADQFAKRPAVNLLQEISKSDYSTRIKLAKWSEKVGALDALLDCGGEKPYKILQPSSSVNYAPLVAEMRKLLSHTHFAVVSKTLLVIAMLAEGIGEKIFPNLRPLVTTILQLSKDKKLTKNASACVDSLFGSVLNMDHLLEIEDSVPSLLDEQKQKNALVRSSSLDFLRRCCERSESAGPRGSITARSAVALTDLCISKLGDSDASVRTAATNCLGSLLFQGDSSLQQIADRAVEGLKAINPRVYTALKPAGTAVRNRTDEASTRSSSPPALISSSRPSQRKSELSASNSLQSNQAPPLSTRTVIQSKSISSPKSEVSQQNKPGSHDVSPSSIDEAIGVLSCLNIPNLEGSKDDGGILECLKDAKWQLRQLAIKSLAAYCDSDDFDAIFSSASAAAILFVVKEHTKGFKESNFNTMKATMELMINLCEVHARKEEVFPEWASKECTLLCVDKIADKKLAEGSVTLLGDLCTVREPKQIIAIALNRVTAAKAPITHEMFLKWMRSLCIDFGAFTLTSELQNIIPLLVKECENSNILVRKAAHAVVGEMHLQLGPPFRALMLSLASDPQKQQIEAACDENKFDARAGSNERARRCVVIPSLLNKNGDVSAPQGINVPKTDLVAALGMDCIANMGSKEGKTAWKLRKEAMDEVGTALQKCNGMVSTSPIQLKGLIHLLRALKERLNDSQSNLKPLAAKLIGSILGSVEKGAQSTLGKIVFAPLINAAINDGKKPMREAALKALSDGTKAAELEGGEANPLALESLMIAFVGEVGPPEVKSGGLPDLMHLIMGMASHLPDLDGILGVRAQPIGQNFAATAVDCLASSRVETRAATEALLRACLERGVISAQTLRTGINHLKPAQQRTVSPIIADLTRSAASSSNDVGKENQPTGDSPLPSPSPLAQSMVKRRPPTSRSASSPHIASSVSRQLSKKPEPPVPEKLHSGHPLGSSLNGSKKIRISRRLNWPEYPEEPGMAQLTILRKTWTSLPPSTTTLLFPEGGIKQQDDAHAGCDVLSNAIDTDFNSGTDEVIQQLDQIVKWISISLCSREKTVGLQAILALLMKLFTFLADKNYTMLDEEAFVLVPLIVEKASIAKGRFKEHFHEVISVLDSCGVISDKSFGSFICVTVIERSHQTKARVLAFQQCSLCVDRVGLAGVGKKGVLLTTKAISDEALPENRTAALDLIEIVLSKMDGDIDKLARICGSNLSDKSRALLEERCSRRGGAKIHDAHSKPVASNTSSRPRGRLVPPKAKGLLSLNRAESEDVPEGRKFDNTADEKSAFRSSLDLRLEKVLVASSPTAQRSEGARSTGPFSFSFKPRASSHVSQSPDATTEANQSLDKETTTPLLSVASTRSELDVKPLLSTDAPSSPTGAAASLRARLLKIREKHRANDQLGEPVGKPRRSVDEKAIGSRNVPSDQIESEGSSYVFDQAIAIMGRLISKPVPVLEDDPDVLQNISILKKFHGAVSTPVNELSSDLDALRHYIESQATLTVERLTSVFSFAFACGPAGKNAGMSVPLLSVVLATLMALFRDEGLSRKVPQDALILLIRETGHALLDSRLTVSSHRESSLDESTSSQMVRAINKLAVQASTGSCRHVSLKALLTLQLQLLIQETQTPNDAAFNRRVSRIITKLFGKVIKAEQGEVDPFSSATVDMESLIYALEDLLAAVYNNPRTGSPQHEDARSTCESMATALLQAMIISRGSREIRDLIEELKIDSSSYVLSLLDSVDPQQLNDEVPTSSLIATSTSPTKHVASKDVASLVSAVASSKNALEREHAVINLRRYRELNGDEEIDAHLAEVSTTFRTFVLQHLNDIPDSVANSVTGRTGSSDGMAVSERLRNLRSKLHAHETAETVEPTEKEHSLAHFVPSSPRPKSLLQSGPRRTPSKIPPSILATPSNTKSVLSLRERLAAAQESRAKADDGQTKFAFGHAAALRARLEAVKKQHTT